MRRFRQQGMLGLLPDHIEVSTRGRANRVPEAVRQEIAQLIALYSGFHYREVVRIIFYTCGYRLHPNTVKELWQQRLPAVQGELTLGGYHGQRDRYQARVQVIKLYYQGWNKLSISRVLHVSRPTVDRWIARFEAEHCAGLVDKGCAPKAPARMVLGDAKGRTYSPEELGRKVSHTLLPRTTNRYGCVTLHRDHFYVEAGVPKTRVLLWVAGEQLRAWCYSRYVRDKVGVSAHGCHEGCGGVCTGRLVLSSKYGILVFTVYVLR